MSVGMRKRQYPGTFSRGVGSVGATRQFLRPVTCDLTPVLKKNSPQAFQLAGCPVDWLGLTEAVTLVAPRSFRYPAQLVTGGSAHTHGLLREMSLIPPTKGSPRTPLELEQPL